MKVNILLFAQLKEAKGMGSFCIQMPQGAKVSDAVKEIMSGAEMQRFNRLPLRFALNECFELPEKALSDGDELAILSPVAGG